MRKNKVALHLSFIMSVLTLAGCVGETPTATKNATVNQITNSAVSSSTDGEIKVMDLAELRGLTQGTCTYSSINPLTICSKDNNVCGQLIACPTATYAPGYGQSEYWVTPEMPITSNTFQLSFKENISKDFHLANIYNDLKGNSPVGQIAQLDTSDCDKLIQTGNTQNKTCNIAFIYRGKAFNELANEVHFIFNDKTQQLLDFSFQVKNTLASISKYPILNTNINSAGVNITINSASEDSNGGSLVYGSSFEQLLSNEGNDSLNSYNALPVISNIKIGSSFRSTETTKLYNLNPTLVTSCGTSNVAVGEICKFSFINNALISENKITSDYGKFVYVYKPSDSSNNIQYSANFIIGAGDILPSDYELHSSSTYSNGLSFTLKKINHANDYISYNIGLRNLKIYAKYDPALSLNSSENSDKLLYAYGDYGTTTVKQLVEGIKFEYDSECFNVGFDPIQDEQNMDTTSCKIRVILPQNVIQDDKPIGFQLYAQYDSDLGKSIDQYIGNIFIDNKANSLPKISKGTCFGFAWATGSELKCGQDIQGGFMTFLDYGQCASNASVSTLDWGQTTPEGKETGGAVRLLICDEYNASYPKPNPGQADPYTKRCFDLSSNGKTLTGKCLKAGSRTSLDWYRSTGWNDATLDFSKCSASSTISVQDDGSLKCDSPN